MLFALIIAATTFDAHAAARFANLALACVHKEYPNKISHSLNSDADVAPPRKLTPAFYGCYDWHSSVHGHWLLARLARTFPDAPFTLRAREALKQLPAAIWMISAAAVAETVLPPLSWAPPHPQYHLQMVLPAIALVVPVLVALARAQHGRLVLLLFLVANAGLSAFRYTRYPGY